MTPNAILCYRTLDSYDYLKEKDRKRDGIHVICLIIIIYDRFEVFRTMYLSSILYLFLIFTYIFIILLFSSFTIISTPSLSHNPNPNPNPIHLHPFPHDFIQQTTQDSLAPFFRIQFTAVSITPNAYPSTEHDNSQGVNASTRTK